MSILKIFCKFFKYQPVVLVRLFKNVIRPEPLATALLTRQTPNPVLNICITRSPSRKRALNDRIKTRYTVKRKTQASAANQKRGLELRSDSFRTSGNCRPKQKQWSSSISTTLWGSDNLDHQPSERHRQGTDRREDKLWTRLNQLDPRKQRSS